MKYVVLALLITMIILSGVSCSRCSFSLGIGYRSVPPTLPNPILYQLDALRTMGATIPYIDLIVKFLEAGGLDAMFHKENQTDLGFWFDFLVD